MTSVMRVPSQIGAREKFLIGVRTFDSSGGVAPADVSCGGFSITASASVGNGGVYTSADVSGFAGYSSNIVTITPGMLFRDLGKELVVIDTDEKYLARFRLAAPVSNAFAEGLPVPPANVWLKVWSAAGTGVAVARTG